MQIQFQKWYFLGDHPVL